MSDAALPPLRRGDVRVRGALATHATSIDVWDGAGWIALQGVMVVTWVAVADTPLPLLRLDISGALVDLMTPREKVALRILQAEDGEPT